NQPHKSLVPAPRFLRIHGPVHSKLWGMVSLGVWRCWSAPTPHHGERSMPRHSSPRALRLAVFVVLALFSLPLTPASAQEATAEPQTYGAKVAALLCSDRSCLEFGPRRPGFTINVFDIHPGELIGSCATDAATEYEGCLATIPVDAQW